MIYQTDAAVKHRNADIACVLQGGSTLTVRLTEVAQRSGVSTATVSRVLNNKMHMPIPLTTVERIKRAAEELGYRPNVVARALATGKTHTIGLYSTEMTDTHF